MSVNSIVRILATATFFAVMSSVSLAQSSVSAGAGSKSSHPKTKQTDATVWQQGSAAGASDSVTDQLPAAPPVSASGAASTLPKPY